MNINDLQIADNLIQRYGVKMLVYGRAGTGKTPSIATLPNPVVLGVEKGMLSLSGSNIPIYDAVDSLPRAIEFFEWIEKSADAKRFDSVAIDSMSEFSTLLLKEELPKHKDPRQAYGKVADQCIKYLRMLNNLPSKHVMLICKCDTEQKSAESPIFSKPLFEGKRTYADCTHLYDEVLFFDTKRMRGQDGKMANFPVVCTKNTDLYIARDRSGVLDEFEYPHMGNIITKIMTRRG